MWSRPTAAFSLYVLARQAGVELTEMCPVSLLNLFNGYHAISLLYNWRKGFFAVMVTICQCWNFKLRYVVVDESFSAISNIVPVIDNSAEESLCLFQSAKSSFLSDYEVIG